MFIGVGLLRADDAVQILLVELQIAHLDRTAKADGSGTGLCLVNDHRMGKNILYLRNAAIELCLLIFCLVIFAVFRKIAKRACLFDLLGHVSFLGGFQIVQFFFQLFHPDAGQLIFFRHNCSLQKMNSSVPSRDGRVYYMGRLAPMSR